VSRSKPGIAGNKSQQFTILKIDTIFDFYKPQPPLSQFVDSFWLYEGDATQHDSERILPTGTLELVINLRQDELRFYTAHILKSALAFPVRSFQGHMRAVSRRTQRLQPV
jgi:hypothetical protein